MFNEVVAICLLAVISPHITLLLPLTQYPRELPRVRLMQLHLGAGR